jgi:hypothetical protein
MIVDNYNRKISGTADHKMSCEEIEDKIRQSEGLCYLVNLTGPYILPGDLLLPEFLYNLFRLTQQYVTRNAVSHDIETVQGKWRSVVDNYRLCKYYYPDCRFRDIVEIYLRWYSADRLGGHYCNDICRTIFGHFDIVGSGWMIRVNSTNIGREFGYYGLSEFFNGLLKRDSLQVI